MEEGQECYPARPCVGTNSARVLMTSCYSSQNAQVTLVPAAAPFGAYSPGSSVSSVTVVRFICVCACVDVLCMCTHVPIEGRRGYSSLWN